MSQTERRDAYIDEILKWENLPIIMNKMRRSPPYPDHAQMQPKLDPATGESYYTYTWAYGNAPKNVQIDIEIDRCPQGTRARSGKPWFHNHDFFEIVYVYAGECIVTTGGHAVKLVAGDVCLYDLQTIHAVQKTSDRDVIFNILISRELFNRSFRELMTDNDLMDSFFLDSICNIRSAARHIALHRHEGSRCEEILRQMICVYYRDEPMWQTRMKALLILLLAEIAQQYRAQLDADTCTGPDGSPELSEIMGYIRQNYADLTLEALSAHFNATPRTMSRFLSKRGGASYKEIVQRIRFLDACSMLTQTDVSIDEIALRIGYLERSSFDRAFKNRYHITAAEYRDRS